MTVVGSDGKWPDPASLLADTRGSLLLAGRDTTAARFRDKTRPWTAAWKRYDAARRPPNRRQAIRREPPLSATVAIVATGSTLPRK